MKRQRQPSASYLERKRWRLSHHEAGHAVACMLKGCEFESIELDPPDLWWFGGATRIIRHRPGAEVFVCLAGPAAEFLANGRKPQTLWNGGLPNDWLAAEEFARRWNHELAPLSRRKLLIHLHREFGYVVEWLREPDAWDAVVRIAASLRERRLLTQDQCRELAGDLLRSQ